MNAQTDPTARQKRAAHPLFVPTFSLDALAGRLPLRIAVPDVSVGSSPKRKYRSGYRYLGWDDLRDAERRANLTGFEVALRLIDFASLRDLLAQHYEPSARGQVAFDPVSLFLSLCLRREMDESWDTRRWPANTAPPGASASGSPTPRPRPRGYATSSTRSRRRPSSGCARY